MALIVPNSIDNDTAADAAEVQQNFAAIQTYVNTNLLNRDGSVALTAPLLLPGDPTQDNHAANKGYVDANDALKVNKAGDTMTGQLVGITPVAAGDLTRKDYVDTKLPLAGGTVTGNLTANYLFVTAAQQSNSAAVTRKSYVDAQDSAYYATVTSQFVSKAEADARYVTVFGDTGLTNNFHTDGAWSAGDTAPTHTDNGSIIRPDGAVVSSVNTGAAPNSLPNFTAIRGGTVPNDVGGTFMRFTSGTTTIGEIEVGPATNQTRYMTSSDYRLKDELGPVVEAIERVEQLRPIRIRWKADGYEQDGFLAHEVDEVVPAAVSGDKDAVDENGDIDPQMIDNNQLVPLLVAAVQELAARVAELEAA